MIIFLSYRSAEGSECEVSRLSASFVLLKQQLQGRELLRVGQNLQAERQSRSGCGLWRALQQVVHYAPATAVCGRVKRED